MKLSNLSLAILVGLGVAACGGSDDNNNQTTPPPGGNTPTPPPAVDNTKPQDPSRVAPGMTVEPQVADLVKAAKVTYAQSGMRDLLTGYAPNAGIVGSPAAAIADFGIAASANQDPLQNRSFEYVGKSTKEADLKRVSSAVNYAKEGQFRTNASDPAYNGAVLANPGFTYALGSNGVYYRMMPAGGVQWDETTPGTKYVPVTPAATNDPDGTSPSAKFPAGGVSQDKLFFLPNATKAVHATLVVANSGTLGIDGTPGGVDYIDPSDYNSFRSDTAAAVAVGGGVAANLVAGQNKDYDKNGAIGALEFQSLSVDHGEVIFKTAHFNGKAYDIEVVSGNQQVDLNSIPLNAKGSDIQYLPVKLEYYIKDTKGTPALVDDNIVRREAEAGAMKAYNLPYSLAFVTVNQKGAEKARKTDGAAARNFFDYPTTATLGDLGAFQVVGYQSPYLPRNGRADYTGKSFGVDSVGNVHLRADFGATGAHIAGAVTGRTYADGKGSLPEITLANIQLSAPGSTLNTTGTKLFQPVKGADHSAARGMGHSGRWDVQLYGPNAEEAGGVIYIANDAVIPGHLEVFTSQRGVITQDSNIAPTP